MSRVSNTYYKGIIGSPDRICIRIPLPFGGGKNTEEGRGCIVFIH